MEKIEEGAVTDSYKLDKNRSIEILNEALATEIVCVLRYQHHYFMATGVHGRGVAEIFKEHADEEREHTDELAERIQQLGGKPNFNPGDLVARSVSQYVEGESLSDMIREDLIAERMVIDVYQRMIEYFGTKDPTTRTLIEHIKAEEEEHASELSDMMFIVDPKTGEDEGVDPGTDPLHLSERDRNRGKQRSQQKGTSPELREAVEDDTEEEELTASAGWGNEAHIGHGGKGSPRQSWATQESDWGNENQIGNGRNRKQSGMSRDDRERGAQGEDAVSGTSKGSNTKQRAETKGTTQQAGRGADRSGSDKKNTNITNRSNDERVTPKAARGEDLSGETRRQSRSGSGNLANAQGRSAADRDTRREAQKGSRGEARPSRDRGGKESDSEPVRLRGENNPPASNIGGVSGRTMNRRRNESLDIDTDDVAERSNRGASSGTNRSPRIMQKNRKNKRAA